MTTQTLDAVRERAVGHDEVPTIVEAIRWLARFEHQDEVASTTPRKIAFELAGIHSLLRTIRSSRAGDVVRQVILAVRGISDDYQTSEQHHSNHVLIPIRKFEQLQAAETLLAALDSRAGDAGEGWKLVPVKPTFEMLNAAIDTDSRKLGDISPLGFRCSPQTMFERCWAAMLAAATPAPAVDPASMDGAKIETYDMMHDIAVNDLGYPSILEALEATPHANSAGHAGKAVAWCSPGQLANLTDVDRDGGVYLPIRKTRRGNFTMPLFATPAPAVDAVPAGEVERFVIRRNGAFFRPNAQGYTTHIVAAGFYTREEADSYASVEGVTIEPLERYRAEAERTIAEANRLLSALSHGEGRK